MVEIDCTNPNTSWHYSSFPSLSWYLNSLAPGKFEWNFRHLIFKQILVTAGWGISREIAMIWMSLDFTDDQSTLVPVMAWCRQAPSHYLSQCWPRSLSPYGVTRPQWVNALATRLFFQQIVWTNNKTKHQRSVLLALFEGYLPMTSGFPSQRASNVESIYMSWYHHEIDEFLASLTLLHYDIIK